MAFGGWRPAALEFFVELEANNTRSWWQEHRDRYDEHVKAPFVALSAEVEAEFGPLHLFRPYRDVRFSRDKTPYKIAAGAVTEGPGGTTYYVQVSAEGLFAGSGYYAATRDQLERYREAVADDRTGPVLAAAVDALRARRYEIGAMETLKTAPRGHPRDHPRIELLRQKGCVAGRSFGAPRWLHTRAALDRIVVAWRDAAAMNRWLDDHVGPSTEPPREPS